MGVHGLWELLAPVGRREQIESLTNKTVAIDISVWLTQFVRAMHDTEGAMVRNAHLLGIFRRCCKLLFHSMRPLFVFDGATPALKRRTLMARAAARDKQEAKIKRLAEKLLTNRIKMEILGKSNTERKEGDGKKENNQESTREGCAVRVDVSGKARASGQNLYDAFVDAAAAAAEAARSCSLEESHGNKQSTEYKEASEDAKVEPNTNTDEIEPVQSDHESAVDGSERLVVAKSNHASNADSYDEIDSKIDISEIPLDLDEETLMAMSSLPPAMHPELFRQLRNRQRLINRQSVLAHANQSNPLSFSQAQINAFLQSSSLNRKISRARSSYQSRGGSARRIASDARRAYLLEEDEGDDADQLLERAKVDEPGFHREGTKAPDAGIGWAQRALEWSNTKAGAADSQINAEDEESDDSMEWEEVDVQKGCQSSNPQGARGEIRELTGAISTLNGNAGNGVELREGIADTEQVQEFKNGLSEFPSCDHKADTSCAPSYVEAEPRGVVDENCCPNRREALQVDIGTANLSEGLTKNLEKAGAEGRVATGDAGGQETAEEAPFSRPDLIGAEPQSSRIDKAGTSVSANGTKETTVYNIEETGLKDETKQNVECAPERPELEPGAGWRSSSVKTSNSDAYNMEYVEGDEGFVQKAREAAFGVVNSQTEGEQASELTGKSASEEPHQKEDDEIKGGEKSSWAAALLEEVREPASLRGNEDSESQRELKAPSTLPRHEFLERRESVDSAPRKSLSPSEIEELRRNLTKEKAKLDAERSARLKATTSVSSEMFQETRDLLNLFGIPFIEAPAEAEAQCAYLNACGIVDAVVTEDADAFLFGATTVYRRLFSSVPTSASSYQAAESYRIEDVVETLGIDRDGLIRLALLLGSDYTKGVRGVGIVNAMEILHAFPGKDGLNEFARWFRDQPLSALPAELERLKERKQKKRKRRRKRADEDYFDRTSDEEGEIGEMKSSETKNDIVEKSVEIEENLESPIENTEGIRRRFTEKHKNVRRHWIVGEGFPSPMVIEAYEKPVIESARGNFRWKGVDYEGLGRFCWEKFGWTRGRFEQIVSDMKRRGRERNRAAPSQWAGEDRFARIRSERLRYAVSGLGGSGGLERLGDFGKDKEKDISTWKVKDIKEGLKMLELPTSGRKKELVERLKEALGEDFEIKE